VQKMKGPVASYFLRNNSTANCACMLPNFNLAVVNARVHAHAPVHMLGTSPFDHSFTSREPMQLHVTGSQLINL
jgi:hypothetical protein